jgi:glycosyltransferase involved in cell wall biosynthesis
MRLLIDLQSCQSGSRHGGIGRYSLALAKAMAARAGSHEVWLLLNSYLTDAYEEIFDEFADLVPREHIVRFRAPGPIAELREQQRPATRIAELLREHYIAELQPDFVHLTSLFEGLNEDVATSVGLLFPAARTAVTLYDLIPLIERDKYLQIPVAESHYLAKVEHLQKAGLQLAISDFSRKEGIELLGLDPGRCVNISSAASDYFRPRTVTPERRARLTERYGIDRPFLMYTASFDQRKNQNGLIEAFSLLPAATRQSRQLVIVGNGWDDIYTQLRRQAVRLGIDSSQVVFTGKVDDETLLDLYNLTELFVFPSYREGFGLPVLEAMGCGAPVIGSNATSIPEVIGRAASLFDPARPADIAARIAEVLGNPGLHLELRSHSLNQSQQFSWERSAAIAWVAIEEAHSRQLTESPAGHRNRRARYLQCAGALAVHVQEQSAPAAETVAESLVANLIDSGQTEPPGHHRPNWATIVDGPADPLAATFAEIQLQSAESGMTCRALSFPTDAGPDTAPPQDTLDILVCPVAYLDRPLPRTRLLAALAEGLPRNNDELDRLRRQADVVLCCDHEVRNAMTDVGLTLPVVDIPHLLPGMKPSDWQTADTGSAGDLLHVCGDPWRDGTDLAISAFATVHRQRPSLRLRIAVFPQHRESVARLLQSLAADDPVRLACSVQVIARIEEALQLLPSTQVLLAPRRIPGLSPTTDAAILAGIPVLLTGCPSSRHYQDGGPSTPLDYSLIDCPDRQVPQPCVMMETTRTELAAAILQAASQPQDPEARQLAHARIAFHAHRRARQAAATIARLPRILAARAIPDHIDIGIISTWNARCGIASYCEALVESFPVPARVYGHFVERPERPDGANVRRCWFNDSEDSLETLFGAIVADRPKALIVQFNYGLFHFEHLNRLLLRLMDLGITVFMIMHSTTDHPGNPAKQLSLMQPALARISRILVHSAADANRLKAIGFVQNVRILRHGVKRPSPQAVSYRKEGAFVLATYGFFLPNKGLLEMIEAFRLMAMRDASLRLLMINAEYPASVSAELIAAARERIASSGVGERITLIADYLSNEESMGYLQQADVLVFPYQETGESSSAAVRMGLASTRPVLVTPLEIFSDVEAVVTRLPGTSPEQIAEGTMAMVEALRQATPKVAPIAHRQIAWLEDHDFGRIGSHLYQWLQAAHVNETAPGSAESAPWANGNVK